MSSERDTMSASDLPELLPCPFCGSEEVFVWCNHRVCCPNCDIEGPSGEDDGAKNIAAWNTRAGDKRAREAVPEGWNLVPVEPTETMAAAFADQLEGACGSFFEWERGGDEGYAAMLASAPTPGEKT